MIILSTFGMILWNHYKGSRIFAEFLEECVDKYPDDQQKWHFELGSMEHVLIRTLAKKPKRSVYKDFREYLDNAFDSHFFGEDFSNKLSQVRKLRNSCAHPSVVEQDAVLECKEIIREKLNAILAYYNK